MTDRLFTSRKGSLPDGVVHLFQDQRANTGQFERTLIVAEEESFVSYLEGCTAPQRGRESVACCHRGDRGGERMQK